MNTTDTLNILLIIALFIITACIVYATYYFGQALKSITALSDDLDEIAQGIKDKVRLKALAAIPALLVALVGRIIKKKRG